MAFYARKRSELECALRVLDFDDGRDILTLESQRDMADRLRSQRTRVCATITDCTGMA